MSWNKDTKYVAIDTETTGITKEDHPFAFPLCDDSGNTIYIEWDVDPRTRLPIPSRRDIKRIEDICEGKTLIFHNISFDISMLERAGIYLDWKDKSFDTSVISHVIDSEVHSKLKGRLKELSLHYLDIPDEDQRQLRESVTAARRIASEKYPDWLILEKKNSGDAHIARNYWLPRAIAKAEGYDKEHPWWQVCGRYAITDAERTMMLFLFFEGIMHNWKPCDHRFKILDRETKLMKVIHDMQEEGLHIFPDKIMSTIDKYTTKMSVALNRMYRIAGTTFNVDSPLELRTILFDKLKCPVVRKTDKGFPSTDTHAISELREWATINRRTRVTRFLNQLDAYKKSSTFNSYAAQYEDFRWGNKLYPSLIQNGTSTTRMASSKPNGQNIKKADSEKDIKGLRNIFGPDYGRIWLCFDYSQLQLRIFAYITQEESMIKAFEDGYDFHAFIASRIFNKEPDKVTKSERRIGKNVNFGFVFGAQPKKIEDTAGVPGLWSTVTSLFPSAHKYMEATKKRVRKHGYVVTPHGYRLYCDAEHKGVNYEVQGCEGDIVKEGMLNSYNYLLKHEYVDIRMIFQVHDELIFDAPSSVNKRHIINIKKCMELPGIDIDMVTPVDVEYTSTDWESVKEMDLG